MTYVVTGGAGFIGSNFLHYLKDQTEVEEQIIVLDNLFFFFYIIWKIKLK